MKGILLSQKEFTSVVYGDQGCFIKAFPSSAEPVILITEKGKDVPYTSSKGQPTRPAKPYYTLNQTYYLKESWQIISIIDYMDHPELNGSNAVFYCDDLNLSNKDIAGELNSYLFDNAMNEDDSVPGLKMKSTPLSSDSSMPAWAARVGFQVISVRYAHLNELTTDDIYWGTGEKLTLEEYRILWDTKAKRSQKWDKNPLVGLYEFNIVTLNGYDPELLNK